MNVTGDLSDGKRWFVLVQYESGELQQIGPFSEEAIAEQSAEDHRVLCDDVVSASVVPCLSELLK